MQKFTIFAPIFVILSGTADAQFCAPVHLEHGPVSVILRGLAQPNDRGVCYNLIVHPGQTVDVSATGSNIAMTIADIGDARDHFHFTAIMRSYTLGVGQLMLSGAQMPYSIALIAD